jgi:hypothetical protein
VLANLLGKERLNIMHPQCGSKIAMKKPNLKTQTSNRGLMFIAAMLLCSQGFVVEARGEKPVDFAREILPVLSDKCFVCHGPDGEAKDDLRLDSFEEATQLIDGHRAIDTAALEKSELLIRIHSSDDPMPPEDAEKQLTAAELERFDRWIRQGGTYAKHWAFVPPKKVEPTATDSTHLDKIDAFVETELKAKRLAFAAEADRATLARRVALVLTGLPPEPADLAAFLNDKREDAYERLVDLLLASPRFGEHQARYWLDAVRYGDTHGLHLDNRRGIYPYRDWVVYALNKNLPLDDFIQWQLAGDLLENPSLEQRVATGFVRMNPSTAEGGVIPAEFQAKNNFDRVQMLGTMMLGLTVGCAQCHTHKYDPISHTEYYRLFAFFNSTSENPLDGNSYTYGPILKAPGDQDQWKAWGQLRADFDQLSAETEAAKAPDVQTKLQKQRNEVSAQIAALEKGYSATTLVTQELPKPRITKILDRGEYDLPIGEPLEPGTLAVTGTFPVDLPRNRLGLAQWLTSREHPLVSRVMVNRVWQRTFGYGLVRTPDDFGSQGQQPTHPELLDWLAVELQDSGWDLKHMVRLMVMSKTFRQSSAWRKDVDDPENRLFARGPSYRLDAEVIRDMGLWASGLLDAQMGGEGVKPYQPKGLWSALMHPSSDTKNYVQDTGTKLYRRSLYVYWKRTSPHPMMTLFDAPSRETSCVRRSRTNTSLQSLGLLNETQRVEMARKLAERILREGSDDRSRLNVLFSLLAARQPTDTERGACMKLLETMRERYTGHEEDALELLAVGDSPHDGKLPPAEYAAWAQLANTVLASDAAISLY